MSTVQKEQLWKEPDWTCPQCGWTNMAIRSHCRNFDCNFGWEECGVYVMNENGVAVPWESAK
jgi:hypothetical protein